MKSLVIKVFFFLLTSTYLLLAQKALPILVKDGEPFKNRDDFYIPKNSPINSIAISEDEKIIVSGSDDGTIKIWNRDTGELKQTLKGHERSVYSVAISRDGKTIISGSGDNTIKIWNIDTSKLEKTLKGHKDSVNSVAISKDGETIISGSNDKTIKIWNRITGKLEKTLERHKDWVNSVAISQDGKTIISGSIDGTIKICNRGTGKLEKILKEHKGVSILSVAISQDGKTIISSSNDKTIKIWNRFTGELEQVLREKYKGAIFSIAISEDGKTIISGSIDKTIKIWNKNTDNTYKLEQTLKGHKDWVNSVAISKDGETIISGSIDKTIKIWNRTTGKLEHKIRGGYKSYIFSVVISTDDKTIISSSADSSIKVWNKNTGKLEQVLEKSINWKLTTVTISKDNKTIICGSNDGTITIWNKDTGKLEKAINGHSFNILSILISEDNKIIISSSSDGTIKVWDMVTYKLKRTIKVHSVWSLPIIITKDNKNIISGTDSGTIKIWDITTGTLKKIIKEHNNIILSLTLSQDNKTIISGSTDGSIRLWDINTGKLKDILKGHKGSILSITISQDNKTIISGSGDKTIKIWDTVTGKLKKTLKGHKDSVWSTKISIDNKTIISGSIDGSICLWDIKTGKKLKEFIGGQNGNWITFDYTKKRLFMGSDGTLIYKKRGTKLTPFYPKEYNLTKPDKLKLNIKQKNIKIDSGKSIELNLTIQNQGDTSYFLVINGSGKYLSMEYQKVPKIQKLQTLNIPLKIYAQLPKNNPKPIQDELNITVITGNHTKFDLTVPIKISSANIRVTKAEISKDKKNLNITIKNSGDSNLTNAKIKLFKPFEADIQNITLLETNNSKTLSYALPIKLEKNATIGLNITIPNIELEKENPYTKVAPIYKWERKHIIIVFEKMPWYIYLFWTVFILVLILLIIYYRLYKNPLVVSLSSKPEKLQTLYPTELKKAKRQLSKINQYQTTLKLAETTSKLVDNAILFYEKPNIEYLSKHLQITQFKKEGEMYRVTINNLGININNFLILITTDNAKNIEKKYMTRDKILIISTLQYQDEIASLAHNKCNNLIAPNISTLTKLLLSKNPREILVKLLADCISFKYLSPYQTKGGIKDAENFFGRVEIIKDIINKTKTNYLLLGARQLGKSSILEALKRHYKLNPNIECYYFNLEYGDIITEINKALKIDKKSSIETIIEVIQSKDKKVIFLIDEADRFVQNRDKDIISSTFRKLSQENHATFILAGFWSLYQSVTMDYHSPLKNFGEVIVLGALETNACQDLMIKPMKRVGITYQNQKIINNLIQKCGNRANLIAMVCDNLLKDLKENTIQEEDIQRGLEKSNINTLLYEWEYINQDEAKNRLNQIIVFLTVELESFTIGELIKRMEQKSIKVELKEIKESLKQLVLAFVLKETKNRYSYQIPLLKERLLEDISELELLL